MITFRVALAAGEPGAEEAAVWLLNQDAPAGGWPCEPGADRHVDTLSTCAVLEALAAVPMSSPLQPRSRAESRRAVEVLLAMQEPDRGFCRFERGESELFMTHFPIRDAQRVRLTALALRQLARRGFQADDDRIARGLAFLWL
jgi:hypothetical protein